MKGKLTGWAIFLAVLLLLSFAATPSFKYSRTADLGLMAVRFSLVILLSILIVREKWKHRDDTDHSPARSPTNETILQRIRRWYYDEQRSSGRDEARDDMRRPSLPPSLRISSTCYEDSVSSILAAQLTLPGSCRFIDIEARALLVSIVPVVALAPSVRLQQ